MKMKPAPLIALLPLSLVSNAFASSNCSCGYSINNTDTQHFALFTHLEETDFLHAANPNSNPKPSANPSIRVPGWTVDERNTTANDTDRALGFSEQRDTVVTNALPEGSWGGRPEGFGESGLQLWVRHGIEDGLVPVASVRNTLALEHDHNGKDKMLYGSYRAGIKFSNVNGTRGVFGWENNQEGSRKQFITMAVSARNANALGLNVHGTDTQNPGDDKAYDMDWISILNLPEEYHEFRFDWLPDRIDFYIDSHLIMTEFEAVPDTAGSLSLKHYVDADREHPPARDAVMTVAYVKVYYNTTTHDEPLESCREVKDNLCVVPDQHTPPNPDGNKHALLFSGRCWWW